MSQQDRYGYGYGYGDYGRAYYRGRRRPRSPFGDIKLAALGKMYADVPVDAVTKAMEGLNLNYKENRDMLDKYKSALAQAKVMAGDEPEKQRIIKDIQSRVDSFVEDTGGAFETGDDFIRGVANDVISNNISFLKTPPKSVYNIRNFEDIYVMWVVHLISFHLISFHIMLLFGYISISLIIWIEIKNPSITRRAFCVPTTRFERVTYGLEVRCSIQLSYVGIAT